jgi:hypothetical protein
MIADRIEARETGAVFLVARQVSGDVRALLDWRGAAVLVCGFLLLRMLRGRR